MPAQCVATSSTIAPQTPAAIAEKSDVAGGDVEHACREQRAAEPSDRSDDPAVVLEEVVAQRQRDEDREQHADEGGLHEQRLPEEPGIHGS